MNPFAPNTSFCFRREGRRHLSLLCHLRLSNPTRNTGKLSAFLTIGLLLVAHPSPARLVTDQAGRSVTIPERTDRLISLAPSITETLYALGLGDQVVGDVDDSDYPPEAMTKPHVGPDLNPSLERIVALKPDLVLGSAEANRVETVHQLEDLRIPVYGLRAHNVDDMLRSVIDLGQVLGREVQARQLVRELRRRIEVVEASVRTKPHPKVLFVVWYRPLITAGPGTFISDVIGRAGGASISDDLSREWPRMNLEDVLTRDPDVILFPRSVSLSPALDEFGRLPGWKDLRAVKSGRMHFVSETIVRPSPRLINALEEVARVLHPSAAGDLRPELGR
jgi:iron complex transport system substrate-binding protein